VRTNKKLPIHPPHELKHTIGYYSAGEEKHVHQAIEAALAVREEWGAMSWETRANIFLRAADLLATKYRPYINASTMLGQSKNVFQAEIDAACELIDFLRFNVHFLSEIYKQQPISSPGMHNRMEYRPLEGFVHRGQPAHFSSHVRQCGCVEMCQYPDLFCPAIHADLKRSWPASRCDQPDLC
jgi:1-pyrroline-5-carboxylate dehydrogenase